MRYTLLLHHIEATPEEIGEEDWKAAEAAFEAYLKALDDAGVLAAAEVLQPVATATTLTSRRGSVQVQDGPFAKRKSSSAESS